jgi:hypothetical protein
MSFYLFLTYTLMKLFFVNYILFSRKNYFSYIYIGVLVVFVEFLMFYNVIDLSYSDDLISYKEIFNNILVFITDISDIPLDSKGLGYLYINYFFSIFFNDFDTVIFIFSLYSVIFTIFFVKYFSNNYKELSILIFLFSVLYLVNRYQLGFSTNIIRSFIGGTIFISILLLSFKNVWFLLLLFIPFYIHDMQTVIGLVLLVTSFFISFKYLKIILIVSIIFYFLGVTNELIVNLLKLIVDEFGLNLSSLIVNEFSLTFNMKIQNFIYIIIPIAIILRNISFDLYNSLEKNEQFFLKFLFTSISLVLLLLDATPRADRIMLFSLPFLYIFFIKFSTYKEKFFYINLVVIFNFIAIYRNLGNMLI